ncbi:MAG: RagB/SusD family nutrient uptake outer membrane protein [Bacteroidales bacterium]|nr:RagB/SusD family nutrient uptake outer membrane protein [Bacteroidales bacterium]
MKKIFAYLFAAAALITGAPACHFLDTEGASSFEPEAIYSNYDLTEGVIFGISETFGQVNSYRGRFLPWYGFNTDAEWYLNYGDGVKSDIATYAILPNNDQFKTDDCPYQLMYMGIERANLAIEGIREYGNPKSDARMGYLLAEALTLRAMIYYDLTKAWGDVPARFSSTSSANLYLKKSSRDVIYKQILADLEEAIPMLPYPGATAQTSRTDRINKVFAEGLYARIALMASGYARRVDDDTVGDGDDPGEIRLSNDPELTKDKLYPKALTYLEDAIASKSAKLEDFATLWRNFNNLDNLKAGPAYETLFVIPFGNGRGRWNFTFAVRYDIYPGTTSNRGGQVGPVPTMWWRYGQNDLRRDVTCVNWKRNSDFKLVPAGIQNWYFGKYRFDQMQAVPYAGGDDDGVKPVVMRYADILLMAAEIANHQGKLKDAQDYMKEVRYRAYKGHEADADAFIATLTDKDKMFDAIVEERALEFCGEFLRKADLIRWNLLKTKLDEAKSDLFALRGLTGKYAYMNDQIYYQVSADGNSISIYGFEPGENGAPAGYTKSGSYFSKVKDSSNKDTGLYDAKINGIYTRDPEQYMFWPFFNPALIDSQGYLRNDYGYANL